MRLRRKPAPTPTPIETARTAAWAELVANAEAPVAVIHARRAGEVAETQQVA
jgi:hypothetical protein